MKGIVFLALFFWACVARAELFAGWTTEEKEWFALSQIVQIVDYQTTRDFLYNQRDKGYYELNPLIGPHPSPDRLMAFEIFTLVGNYFLVDYLSHENRLTYLKIHVAIELLVIQHNIAIGARINF